MVTGNACRNIVFLLLSVWTVYTFISRKYDSVNFRPKEADDGYHSRSENSSKRIIMIIAYMRTGSTLTAAFLQEYPDAFYAYEPIRDISLAFNGLSGHKQTLTRKYFNGSERSFKASDKTNAIFDEINNWTTCKLDSLSIGTLTQKGQERKSKIMKNFSQCIDTQRSNIFRSELGGVTIPKSFQTDNNELNRNKQTSIDACFNIATHLCEEAPFLLLKFIRLQMKDVITFIQMYAGMKIIHLVRDPRGIFYSRLNIVRTVNNDNFEECVQTHCSLIEDNLKYSKQILEKYQDRLKILRYEDLADSPIETAREVLAFAGISFVKPLKDFIRNQTRAAINSDKWGVQRRNSSRTASKWRTLLGTNLAKYAYEACEKSNRILGYLPFETDKEMRDFTIPSRKKVDILLQLSLEENI